MASETAKVASRCSEAQENLHLDLSACRLASMPLGMFTLLANTPLNSADFSNNELAKVHSKISKFTTLTGLHLEKICFGKMFAELFLLFNSQFVSS